MNHVLEISQRMPREQLRYANYPEVALIEENLATLMEYVSKANSAVSAYQENETDKVYLNVAELKSMLEMSYTITDTLGTADNVCFDLLLSVRDIQETLHDILYARVSQGDVLVSGGNPPSEEELEEESEE